MNPSWEIDNKERTQMFQHEMRMKEATDTSWRERERTLMIKHEMRIKETKEAN